MNQDIIRQIENEQLKTDRPDFRVGDTIRVYARIKEGTRERIQMFEGTVLKRQNGGLQETFTVRRMSYGVGVEKTWPLHSPVIDRIEVVRRGSVRRAKLYYLRDRVGKAAKVKEKNLIFANLVKLDGQARSARLDLYRRGRRSLFSHLGLSQGIEYRR